MKNWILLSALALVSCQNKPTLQQYFVDSMDKKEFVTLDVAPSILNIDQAKIAPEQKKALASFERMNILALKRTPQNGAEVSREIAKMDGILKDPQYQELIKFGSGKDGVSIRFLGEDEHIDEFVVYAKGQERGLAVVRILGNDMNPTDVVNIVTSLQSSNFNLEQLKPLKDMLPK